MRKKERIDRLRKRILRSLRSQGFKIRRNIIVPPDNIVKDQIRQLHATAAKSSLAKAQKGLARYEGRLLERVVSGAELDPAAIQPALVRVMPGSFDEKLFRHTYLHWSVPISTGYGRRLRYLVVDRAHGDALIGIIGLHDPVIALKARDAWIGWDAARRLEALHHVMDAFVLGAVPPYSSLLGGKLVALLATSREIQDDFREVHGGRISRISERMLDSHLALLTTTSALGRSSIYNRLKHEQRSAFVSVGMTAGSGDFHFANGTYAEMVEVVRKYGAAPRDRKANWGEGFRNRREVIYAGLALTGLPRSLRKHGVAREVFVIPLAHNTQAFLRGEEAQLRPFGVTVDELFAKFRTRWLMPRAQTNTSWVTFDRASWRLWPDG